MKKFTALMLALVFTLTVFVGCTAQPAAPEVPETPAVSDADTAVDKGEVINLGGLTGPTTMGMVKLLSDNEAGSAANDYNLTLAGSADILTPMLINGELDIAAVPANLASVLYNRTEGKVSVLAINTLGVLYIVEKGDSITTLEDLKGKKIYATGQSAAPEYAIRYVLSQNGIDPDNDVTLEFYPEPAEVVSLMATDETAVAMLPQPYVTVAKGKVEGLRVVLDITEEWNKLGADSECLTGVVVAQKQFIEENPEQVARFLEEYKASIEYTNANVAEAAALCEHFEVIKAAVAEKAIPECNIVYIDGAEMKTALSGYLTVLHEQNPKSVGGALPADDFYYVG